MKKKLYFLTIIMCILGGFNLSNLNAQTPVTIGSGDLTQNENDKFPLYTFYEYSISQQIYTADDLAQLSAGAVIKSIAFNVTSTGGDPTNRFFSIYMQNTTKDEFSSATDHVIMNSSDLVYTVPSESPITFNTTTGWYTFILDTPFTYEGNNILVCVHDYTNSYASPPSFSLNSTEGKNRAIFGFDYNSIGDPVSGIIGIPNEYNMNLGMIQGHNQIKLTFEGGDPVPLSLSASATAETIYDDETVKLAAKAKGGSGNYTYSWSPATVLDNATIATPTFTPTAAGTYTFTCTVNDGETTAEASVTVNVEERPAIKQYRIKAVGHDKYLNIAQITSYNTGGKSGVDVAAYAESDRQIFTIEDAGNSNVYFRSADEYYINCLGGWMVCAYGNTTSYAAPLKMLDQGDGTFIILCNDGYFKVEEVSGGLYPFSNGNSSNVAAKWTLEEVVVLEPAIPTGLTATPLSDSKILLEWEAAENALSYKVYMGNNLLDYTEETSYLVENLAETTDYCFKIKSVRGTKESDFSDQVCEKTKSGNTAPDEAATLEAVASSGAAAITLTWNEVAKATYYNVYDKNGVLITTTSETTYTAEGLELETEYCYTVKAANEFGESLLSSEKACATTYNGIPIKVIGEGTYTSGSTRVPTNTYNLYSVSQQIYTQSEIGLEACEISKIAIYQTSSYSITRDLEIYMVNTDKVVFSSNTDWVNMSESNKVFDGSYTFVPGWCEIELAKDFSYEGENILLCVIDNTKTSTSTISFKQNNTPSSYQTLYHFTDSGTYGPFVASNLTSTGTRKYQNTYIKLFYKVLPNGVTATPEQVIFDNVIRGGNYWSEKNIHNSVEAVSLKAKNVTISDISLDDNSFFTIPANIDLTADPVEFNIGHKANPTAGTKTANLIVTHSAGTTLVPLSATVYEPATADVFEKAQNVTINVGTNSFTPDFANLHDDYILPGEVSEGITPDAVYKFVLSEDAMLDINITGTNAVTALYKGDFNGNGPSNDNNYQLSSTKFFFDFESGDFSGLTLKDADGDGRNWEIYSGGYNGSNYCAISYSYNDASYTPENYIITDKKYYITESSTLSFQASSHQSHSYLDGYTILVSENGNNFEEVTSNIVGTVDQFSLQEIDLSEYAGRELYIAINHYTDDKYNLRIDDLRLSDGTDDDAQSDIYPAGTYYLVAAAENSFTVNITKTALPAPEAITYTSPIDGAKDQVNPVLSFELGKYTTEYQVLFGETNPPAVVKDWTAVTKSEYINSFQTEGLEDNKKYYWQIKARNSSGEKPGVVYSFTTPLNKPTNVVISDTEIFSDEETTITWEAAEGALYYKVYVDGVKHNAANITGTSYVLSGLSRRINPGYDVTVTAVHTLGESSHTEPINVKVSGYCDLTITVVNTTDVALEGAELSLYGINEFGETVNYGPLTTDENGQVSQRVNMLKSGESYYVNVVKAPYTTITDFALVPDNYMSENGNLQLMVTMNLPAPANFRAENDKIYEGDDVVLHWDEVAGATAYNVYVDGVFKAEVSGTTHTISGLAYNPTGYNVTVTTVLPEGESIHSDAVLVKVGGTFTLVINVKDNNENPLEGVAVVMTLDEYSCLTDAIDNNLQTSYELTTDSEGKVNVEMPLFKEEYTVYNVALSKEHYENGSAMVFYYGNDYPDAAFRTNGGVYEVNCTLSLGAPEGFMATKDYYVEGSTATFVWNSIEADNLLGYNIYTGDWNNSTLLNTDGLITRPRYFVYDLEAGNHTYFLTAVYDLGESPKASTYIEVIRYGSLSGKVTDEGGNPISNATVMITGKNRFDEDQVYHLYTDVNGNFSSNEITPSHWDPTYQYVATVSKPDYISKSYSPISVESDVNTNIPTIVLQAKPETTFNVTAEKTQNYEGDDEVDITWDNVANSERYNVYRKDLSNDQVTQLNEYNITWTNYSDNNWMTLPNGDYQYGVSAFIKNVTAESFENGTIPAGWKLEADFIEEDWTIYDNTASYITPRTGNYAIYRNGDCRDSGLPNHIIMAPIDMTNADNATLSFYYVNVNSPNGGDWVNTLKVSAREYVPENNTNNWNELYSTNYESTGWTNETLDLDEYAGKRVEVRFSVTSNYARYVAIDDITVTLPSEESKINWSNTLTKEGIEFIGDGDWNTADNWNKGVVPGEEDNVSIIGNATINTDVTVKSLTISEGGSLTVESGTLNVTKGIINNIASAFVIEDGAQVKQNNNDVKATFRMNIEAPTSWDTENKEGWQFIASPMKDAKTASFETIGTDFDLFKYEGEKELEWVNYKGHNEDVISGATYLFDFTDGFDGWGVIDANGDGYSWGHNLTDEGMNFNSDNTVPEGYDDAGYLFNDIQWWNGESNYNAAPDDYLVAPYMMTIGKYSALRFKLGNYSSITETPEISVLVSEVNKNTEDYVPADFTTVGIAPIVSACWGAYEEVIISLDAYIGKDVRVAIRHNAPDSWNSTVIIDKVELANIAFETEFQQGRGYLASYETASTVEFEGTLNNETVFTFNEIKTINENNYFANFYLLGNPFAFNMNWENVTAEGLASGYSFVALDGSYDYAVDGEIKVGDGFFVKVTGENPSLSYRENNGMGMRNRRTEKSSFINLIASNKAGSDNVIINFAGNEEEGFAKLENFNEDIAEIYVKDNEKRYGILNYDEDIEEIDVYFNAKKIGYYTINAISNADFSNVTLIDRITGIETNILTDSYTFQATTNDSPERFIIRIDKETESENFVYKSGEELIINAKGCVQIIDVMGRIVYSNDIVNDNHRINISSFKNATYIVRVVNTNEVKTQKIVIW